MNGFSSVETLMEANKAIGIYSEYTQLKPGVFDSGFTLYEKCDVNFVHETHKTAIQIRGTSSQYDFLVPLKETKKCLLLFNGCAIDDSRLNLIPPNTELHISTSGAISCPQMSIPAGKLQRSVSTRAGRDIDLDTSAMEHVDISPEAYHRLANSIVSGNDAAGAYDFLVEKIVESLSCKCAISRTSRRGRPAKNNVAVLGKAVDFIQANLHAAIDIESVCRACLCSQSKLERIFMKYLDVTPKSYIISRKLQAVRSELHNTDDPTARIEKVALAYGFNHMGRFASYYREFFKEYPRETLKGGRLAR